MEAFCGLMEIVVDCLSLAQAINRISSAAGNSVIAIHNRERWDDQWQIHQDSNKLMVISFLASYPTEPILKTLAARYPDVDFVNIARIKALKEEWEVEASPTFVMVKRGKEVGRVIRAREDEIETKILQVKLQELSERRGA